MGSQSQAKIIPAVKMTSVNPLINAEGVNLIPVPSVQEPNNATLLSFRIHHDSGSDLCGPLKVCISGVSSAF
jgi:hypothetical protein